MIEVSDTHLQILAVLMNEEKMTSDSSFFHKFSEAFGKGYNYEKVRAAVTDMKNDGLIIEFDPEYDALDTAVSITHSKHGDIEISDLDFMGMDDFWSLGPEGVVAVLERPTRMAEIAADAGLPRALDRLKRLPVDTSRWTGLPRDFVFNDAAKAKCLSLLRTAKHDLDGDVDNARVAQARDLITAAIILAEAPEPQPDLVWEIIQRVATIVGLTQAIAGLLALFGKN